MDPAAHPAGLSALTLRRGASSWVVAALVAFGVVVRVVQWAAGRSFWLDEVALALNLQTRSYAELTGTLDSDQSAPVGWLWVERWLFVHVGYGERTLRLLPLLFGCATVVVVALLARRVLSRTAAVVAVALTAVAPTLIYYSDDLKQYSSDTFWVPLLALLTLSCLGRGSWPGYLRWGIAGAVGSAFSQALLLALPAYGAVLLVAVLVRRRPRELLPLAAAGAVVLGAAVVEYLVQLRAVAGNQALLVFWARQQGFPAQPLTVAGVLSWLGNRARVLPTNPFSFHPAAVVLVLLALGTVALAVHRRPAFFVLMAPVPVAFAAAIAHRYPLADRVALFLVPTGLLIIAAAVDLVPGGRRRIVASAAAVLAAVAIGAPQAAQAGEHLTRPIRVSETHGAFAYVAAHLRPGDGVFVHYAAGTSALFYTPKIGIPWDGTLYLGAQGSPTCMGVPAGPQLARHPRVWIVFGIRLRTAPVDEQQVILALAERTGRVVDAHHDTQAAAYLIEEGFPAPSQPSLTSRPGMDCLVSQTPPAPPPLP